MEVLGPWEGVGGWRWDIPWEPQNSLSGSGETWKEVGRRVLQNCSQVSRDRRRVGEKAGWPCWVWGHQVCHSFDLHMDKFHSFYMWLRKDLKLREVLLFTCPRLTQLPGGATLIPPKVSGIFYENTDAVSDSKSSQCKWERQKPISQQ